MSAAPQLASKPSLTLKRRLNARPEKVYAAWTDPAQIVRWFGPSQTLPASVRAELDVREGGRFRASFKTDDGEYHEVSGVYREVVPNEKLVFTWAWYTTPERESLVTVLIREDGDGAILTLTHEQFFDEAARDGHKRGWTGTLEKLERYLSKP
ncbi:MAG TPA: SRPBCC domain-containing protein [Xanthobacteraceae bacterium]|nr:SRPBCC domain-containing protein [Xanthobacteraceae bacterium]